MDVADIGVLAEGRRAVVQAIAVTIKDVGEVEEAVFEQPLLLERRR